MPLTLMANLPVTKRPTLVMRCWPSSTARLALDVEVDQAERVALEERVDDRDILLAVAVDVGVAVLLAELALRRREDIIDVV